MGFLKLLNYPLSLPLEEITKCDTRTMKGSDQKDTNAIVQYVY